MTLSLRSLTQVPLTTIKSELQTCISNVKNKVSCLSVDRDLTVSVAAVGCISLDPAVSLRTVRIPVGVQEGQTHNTLL